MGGYGIHVHASEHELDTSKGTNKACQKDLSIGKLHAIHSVT